MNNDVVLFLSNRAMRRKNPMRTTIITSTTNVFGFRQDRRIVTVGNDRCALAHARPLPAWHMHLAMAWLYADAMKRGVKQVLAAALRTAVRETRVSLGSQAIESVVVRSRPRVSVGRA